MDVKSAAQEDVNLIKIYRNGQQESHRMPRWVAEMEIGCIPLEQPDVASARIESIQIDQHAAYPLKRLTPGRAQYIALFMADFLEPKRVA